jgi:hypothetical protein
MSSGLAGSDATAMTPAWFVAPIGQMVRGKPRRATGVILLVQAGVLRETRRLSGPRRDTNTYGVTTAVSVCASLASASLNCRPTALSLSLF